MNIVFQLPKCIASIGIGHDAGFPEVPEAKFIRKMLAGFISTIPELELAADG
jgi:hypothetical protein